MAVTPNFAQELGSIDFGQVIGGPLVAAVEAHNLAQVNVAEFLLEIGFEDTTGDKNPDQVRVVTFTYKKEVVTEDGKTVTRTINFTVPFILLIDLPYFEVDSVDISLNVELSSVETQDKASKFGIDAEARVKHGWLVGKVNLKVSTSYTRTSTSGSRVERKYAYQVHVHAGSTEAPRGVDLLLNTLSGLITEQEQPPPEQPT
ncbi:DUF2589 domain-containing protein [Streptomyces sp. NPDC002888]|uniref:DUF2589 domain-containing protein n=1 Tax=Streptomyces sp. NPDC002888 TaxID=3364668 RepID=UPI0036A9CA27